MTQPVTVAFETAKKVMYVALGVEVRRDRRTSVIACMRCVRPACVHVNDVRVHLGLPPLPKVRYPEDEQHPTIDIGGIRVIPDRIGSVASPDYYDEVAP